MDSDDDSQPSTSTGHDRQPEPESYSDMVDRAARRRLMEIEDERPEPDSLQTSTQHGKCCKCCSCLSVSLYCQLWSKADRLLLASCITVALLSGAVTALYLGDHYANHGKCILSNRFRPGGTMEYYDENIWCHTSMFFHVISIGMSIGLIFVNWIAQLNNNLCWQKLQAVIALMGSGGALLSGITLMYGYIRWCGQIVDSFKCSAIISDKCDPKDSSSCLSASKAFDSKVKAEEKMETVFWYALGESVAVWLAAVFWVILTVTSFHKLLDGIRQEQRKQREAERMFITNQPGTGGYQQSSPRQRRN